MKVALAAKEFKELISAARLRHDNTAMGVHMLVNMCDAIMSRSVSVNKACLWLGWIQASLYKGGVSLETIEAINKKTDLT